MLHIISQLEELHVATISILRKIDPRPTLKNLKLHFRFLLKFLMVFINNLLNAKINKRLRLVRNIVHVNTCGIWFLET